MSSSALIRRSDLFEKQEEASQVDGDLKLDDAAGMKPAGTFAENRIPGRIALRLRCSGCRKRLAARQSPGSPYTVAIVGP